MSPANIIDHVAIVVDKSYSMNHLKASTIAVVDRQVAALKEQSQVLNREIRVSVYAFDDHTECLIFDMDVFRVPSIADRYRIGENTALCAATLKSQDDLATTSQVYGDHSFLTFVITDGADNRSRGMAGSLRERLERLPENWTVAALVPDEAGRYHATQYGFQPGNIAIWDTTSARGMAAAGDRIHAATSQYLTNRSSGIRGTRNLFDTSAARVNTATVQQALKPLAGDKYRLIPVEVGKEKVRADEFVRDHCGIPFVIGNVYYQWSKKETVQPQKRLAVVNKKTDQVFVGTGDEIRDLIGLPSMRVRDVPKANPDYQIFVQSTAPNRHLIEHTKALVML